MMVNVKLGDITYEGVNQVKLDTTDGGEAIFTLGEGYEAGFEAGEKSEYDRFWDAFQKNGDEDEYQNAFGPCWDPVTFRPKYNIRARGAYQLFLSFGYCYWRDTGENISLKQSLADAGVSLTFPGCFNISYAFRGTHISEIGELDFSTVTRKNCVSLFYQSNYLKTIDKIILPAEQTTFHEWFYQCYELENLSIEGVIGADFSVGDSPKLTHDSIMSIINCLEAKDGGTWTCTLGETNLAKLTDAEKAIATQKGWTLA